MDSGPYIDSIVKTAHKKIATSILSIKFLSPKDTAASIYDLKSLKRKWWVVGISLILYRIDDNNLLKTL